MADKALLVGINSYAYPNELQGCLNDVQGMARFLVEKAGFQDANIRLLVDARATAQAIRERLRWLVCDAAPEDRLIFHFSGHGALLPLRSPDGEVEKVHDCICPIDFDFTVEHALVDEHFNELFSTLPDGVRFYWISDSCHSGQLVTRDMGAASARSRQFKARTFHMPMDLQWRLSTARHKGLAMGSLPDVTSALNLALISGCRSDEVSADDFIDGGYHGVLSYFLLQELDANASSDISHLHARLAEAIRKAGYAQNSQLVANRSLSGLPFALSTTFSELARDPSLQPGAVTHSAPNLQGAIMNTLEDQNLAFAQKDLEHQIIRGLVEDSQSPDGKPSALVPRLKEICRLRAGKKATSAKSRDVVTDGLVSFAIKVITEEASKIIQSFEFLLHPAEGFVTWYNDTDDWVHVLTFDEKDAVRWVRYEERNVAPKQVVQLTARGNLIHIVTTNHNATYDCAKGTAYLYDGTTVYPRLS